MFFENTDRSMEFFHFFFGQPDFDNVFYTVFAYFHGYGSETVFNSVRAVEINGAGEDFMLIVIDGADQFCRSGGDAEFRAAFGRIFYITFFMDFF